MFAIDIFGENDPSVFFKTNDRSSLTRLPRHNRVENRYGQQEVSMKSPISLIALIYVSVVSGMCVAENLIPNGDFAKGEVGKLPDEWTVVTPNPALAPTFQLVEENGKKFLTAQGNGRKECFGYAKTPFTVEKGKTYRMTVRFKIEGMEDVNRHLLHGLFGDFNNGVFKYRRESEWIIGEHSFTAAGEKCEMRLYFRFSPHGKVRWDEVRLEEREAIAPRLVKIAVSRGNRDFEGWKSFLDAAGEKKCDIALLTEFYVTEIQKADSSAVKMLSEKAKEWKMCVSGTVRLQRDDVVYNSAPFFDREGKLLGTYDKVNLYDPELDEGTSPGESVQVFKTDFGNVGMMTCYDSWHPAVAKLLALKGAEVILCPNAGYYMQIMYARSADNGVVVAVTSSTNPCGVWDAGGNLAGENLADPTRCAPKQIVAFEESADKSIQFVTVDLSIEASPHYWGGPMLSAPGGRRVRATGAFYLEDEIQQEVRRWETPQ